MPNFTRERIDLSNGVPKSAPERLDLRSSEWEITDFQGDVWMRLDNSQGPRRKVRKEYLCEGPYQRAFFDTDGKAQPGAFVEVEVRDDFRARAVTDVEKMVRGFDQRELQVDLQPGATIQDGEDACELVGVAGVRERLRVRARVSGTSSVTRTNDPDVDLTAGVAVDQGRATLFALDNEQGADASIIALSLDDPDNPAVLDTLTFVGFNTGMHGVAYDPANQKVVGVVNDGSGTPFTVFVVDASDPTALVLDGTTSLGFNASGGGERLAQVDIDTTLDRALVSAAQGAPQADARRLALVDHTGGGAPTILQTLTGKFGAAIETSGKVWTLDEVDPLLQRIGYTASGFSGVDRSNGEAWTLATVPVVDPELGIVFAGSDLDDVIYAVDTETGATLYSFWNQWHRSGVVQPEKGVGAFGHATLATIFVAYDRSGATVQQSDPANAVTLDVLEAGDVYYGGDLGSLIIYSSDPGSDILRVQPVRSDGTPTSLGAPSEVTLRDGQEAKLDVPTWWGEQEVQVCILARSGTQTTVDFVEVSGS